MASTRLGKTAPTALLIREMVEGVVAVGKVVVVEVVWFINN
jgi:hypothetical protein